MAVNPLTFVGNSSIIYQSGVKDPSIEQQDAIKQEFAKLYIEKIFMQKVAMTEGLDSDDDEDSIFSGLFSNDISEMLIDEVFRQQVAEQMVADGTITFD